MIHAFEGSKVRILFISKPIAPNKFCGMKISNEYQDILRSQSYISLT